ncbi:MAG: diaminopimelate decarboxylase [Dehalococcoidia bacterium]
MQKTQLPLARVLPVTAEVNDAGRLAVGGCDLTELASEFGTPLYAFDEETLRGQCRAFIEAFRSRYAETAVAYAAKAYLGRALAAIMAEEGMDLDVVSGGELAIARSVNFPAERIHFHGNNKSEEELADALDAGIGRVIVDNFHEIHLLSAAAQARGIQQRALLRLSPGVDPHTHHHTTTGTLDNKFGVPLATQGEAAVRQMMEAPGIEMMGLHVHLGSPVFEREPFAEAIDLVCDFAARMKAAHGFEMREFSPGGGFAVDYVLDQHAPSPDDYAETIVPSLRAACKKHGLSEPRLIIEPGRSIVARAGVAVYTVGSSKDVPGVRRYVSVDGGMGDNIRPGMYDSKYAAIVANRPLDTRRETVTVAGKYCESGDLLLKDAELPPLEPGDILAMPAAGGYALPMASNYNAALRPPVVLVHDGRASLMRRRETYEDLTRADVWPLE